MNLDEIFNNSFEKKVIDSNLVSQRIKECRDLVIDKFSDIEFIEEGHIYKIDEIEYTSVSNIIKKYEPEVDWDQKAADYARKWGKKKEDVQKEWKLNNLKSTISGTRTHSFGESYTNLLCGHPELICEQNKPQYIEEFNTMVSTYPKEDAVRSSMMNWKPIFILWVQSSSCLQNIFLILYIYVVLVTFCSMTVIRIVLLWVIGKQISH